jgi:hypothetical protein
MRLVARLRQESGRELSLRSVFEGPTPRALAARLREAAEAFGPPLVPGMGTGANGEVVLSWGQQRLWALDRLEGLSAAYNIPLALRLNGPVDATALGAALRRLVVRHQASGTERRWAGLSRKRTCRIC